jgi:hypothetical protein
MIIVSGRIYVRSGARPEFLKSSLEAVAQARQSRGCRDFVVSADPIEPDGSTSTKSGNQRRRCSRFAAAGPVKI